MSERKIAPVKDNLDKQRTYAKQKMRYKSAITHGFYLEAMMIDYALLEDRLRSILYHMAFLANRKATKAWGKTRPYFSEFVRLYKSDKENEKLGITNISGKIKIVRSVLLWVSTVDGSYEENEYLKTLKAQCEGMDLGGVLLALDEIKTWCDYRNEIVHALMNKNLESVQAEIKEKAEEGMRLANYLDAQERVLKAGNKIRKSAKAPIEK